MQVGCNKLDHLPKADTIISPPVSIWESLKLFQFLVISYMLTLCLSQQITIIWTCAEQYKDFLECLDMWKWLRIQFAQGYCLRGKRGHFVKQSPYKFLTWPMERMSGNDYITQHLLIKHDDWRKAWPDPAGQLTSENGLGKCHGNHGSNLH